MLTAEVAELEDLCKVQPAVAGVEGVAAPAQQKHKRRSI